MDLHDINITIQTHNSRLGIILLHRKRDRNEMPVQAVYHSLDKWGKVYAHRAGTGLRSIPEREFRTFGIREWGGLFLYGEGV